MRRVLLATAVAAIGLGSLAVVNARPDDGIALSDIPERLRCATEPVARQREVTPIEVFGVRLREVAVLEDPTALAVHPSGELLIARRPGEVLVMSRDGTEPRPVLDITNEVNDEGAETGLLGMAVSPDRAFVYLHYTDTNGVARIVAYGLSADGVDRASRRELLALEHTTHQHQGGQLVFGPDGMLYIAFGDGGDLNYEGDPEDDAQELDDLLGSILRIDPRPSRGKPYAVPADNPFVDTPGARPEVWAYGLRNPWRFTFDRKTGEVWIADTGHFCWEEVNHLPPGDASGANFGWNRLEGRHRFVGSPPAGHVLPVWEYRHTVGDPVALQGVDTSAPPVCAIVGGYVYRGTIESLQGLYVYGDFCADRLYVLRDDGSTVAVGDLDVPVEGVLSFGEDERGELYVLTAEAVHRLEAAS